MKGYIFVLAFLFLGSTMTNVYSLQSSNFVGSKSVGEENLVSKYKDGLVLYARNDSFFVAKLDKDGKIQSLEYTSDFNDILPEGQVSYGEKSGKLYYAKAGKIFTAKQKKSGKWKNEEYIQIAGTESQRDNYKGSVLAYATWRYKPKDSIVVLNPVVNADETVMYFASNLNGSDNLDIWKVEKDQDGEWGKPQRLSPQVNSSNDENYPYIREDGTLQFASNRTMKKEERENGKYNLFVADLTTKDAPKPLDIVQKQEREKEILLAKNETTTEEKVLNSFDKLKNIGKIDTTMANPSQTDKDSLNRGDEGEKQVGEKELIAVNDNKDTKDDSMKEMSSEQKKEQIRYEQVKKVDAQLESNPDAVIKVSENVMATHQMRIFYFEFDKDIPNGTYKEDLLILLDFINAYPESRFLLVGHTDERGSDEYNDALSLKRAEWVYFNLLLKDVKLNRLEIRGDGEKHPIYKNAKTEEEHQKNRRVEVIRLN